MTRLDRFPWLTRAPIHTDQRAIPETDPDSVCDRHGVGDAYPELDGVEEGGCPIGRRTDPKHRCLMPEHPDRAESRLDVLPADGDLIGAYVRMHRVDVQ